MDLLTPAESHAFQNFLSAMDYTDLSPSEWAMLNGTNNNTDDDILAPTQSSDALAKATKDLMALSAGRWDSLPQQQHGVYTHHLEQHHHHQTHPNVYSHRQTSYRTETFPFLNPKAQMHHSMLSLPPHSTDLHAHMTSPIPTSTSTSATTTPATPQSPFCFPDLSSHSSSHLQLPQVHLNQPLLRQQRPPSPGPKRSSSNAASSAKRLRPSPPTTSSSIASSSAGPTKQTLLSPSQKKANHIQSEQKRRANIRRGYEALCDTVPALREAIREEEEAEARMSMGLGSSGKPSRSKRKKKDTAGDDKEKIDGRAGPRSENVVLSKTIEYINDLISERSALLARLERARSSLSVGHPALVPACTGVPLWEREWKGGEGKVDGEGGDEEDDDCGDST